MTLNRNGKLLKLFIYLTLAVHLLLPGASAFAAEEAVQSTEQYLSIATTDSRPMSVERLLYMLMRNIKYSASFTVATAAEGCENANDGRNDGVISLQPDLEMRYGHLVKVSAPLDKANLNVYVRSGYENDIWSYSALSGKKLGVSAVDTYFSNNIPKDAFVTNKTDIISLTEGLLSGEYDYAIMVQREYEDIYDFSGIEFAGTIDTTEEFLYLNEKHENLASEITGAINEMRLSGTKESILSNEPIPELSEKKMILHIISTNTEVTTEDEFSVRLNQWLRENETVELYAFALNARRFSPDSNRLLTISSLIKPECVPRDISAVLVSGIEAFNFVKERYEHWFPNVPVLYYGADDGSVLEAREFIPLLKGVAKTVEAFDTVKTALKLFPDTKNVYVLNDYTAEGSEYRRRIESQLKPFENELNIEYNPDIPCEEIMLKIKDLPPDSIVLLGSYFRDSKLQYYSQSVMKRALEEYCSVPVFSLYSGNVGYNAIGGKYPNYQAFSGIITEDLDSILGGEDPSKLSFITDSSEYNRWVFDKTLMDKWSVKESSLPEGSEIINKAQTIWQTDPRFAYSLIALFSLIVAIIIIVSVFYSKYRRQQFVLSSDAKIREVKERLERIINTAPIAFVLTVNGVIREINDYAQNNIDIKINDEASKFYADSGLRDKIIKHVSKQGATSNEIVRYNMKNSEPHRFLCNFSTAEYEGHDAFILWGVDIEESEIKKDQLKITQRSLQTVLDMMPAAIRVLNIETGRIAYANKARAEMFAYETPEEQIGQSYDDCLLKIQPDGIPAADKYLQLIGGEEPVSTEFTCVKKTGEIFETMLTARTIDYFGIKASLGIFQDLTAEKDYQRMLIETVDKEKEANQLKSVFLSNMSHEIRTPMNAIIGLTEIELRRSPPKEAEEVYKKINMSAKNLLQIVNDILDLSKIEADKIELYMDEFELEDVLNSALLVVTPRLDGKNVELMLNASPDLPKYVIGDKTRLWQILKNFLDNASKFTESGRIVITVRPEPKRFADAKLYITFAVKDTGIGMNETQLSKVFLPYEQIYSETQKRYSGTGLGMSISKQLCELMGGELSIESEYGRGTLITFSVPFEIPESANTQEAENAVLSGVNVLAVDDDDISLSIMETLLKSADAKVTLAHSGNEAIDIILSRKNSGENFDIILLDYVMKGLNGLETARQIHMNLSRAPKLLMVTAYQRQLLKSDLEKSGIDDVLEKPFIPSRFIGKILDSLGLSGSSDESREQMLTRFSGKVLVCEDNPINQEVASGMLYEFGISAEIASNGQEGVDMLKSGKDFDLILMDLHMPVMDGYEAARLIRADSRFDSIPIISLSADAMSEVINKCLEVGMNDHLSKPIEFESLQEALIKWLPSEREGGSI